MNRYGFIYLTTNIINGKIYIGQKVYSNPNVDNPVPSYIGSGTKIKNAITKYGKHNFTRKILCWCTNQKALDECEKFFIKYYDSMNKDIGYNLCEGGQLLVPRELLCRYGKDNPNYGHKWTDEMKRKMSENAKKRNIFGKNNPNYGNKWTDEQKAKASLYRKQTKMFKGKNNPRATQVMCLETGEKFDTIKELATILNKKESTIYSAIRRKGKINNNTYVKINNNSPS